MADIWERCPRCSSNRVKRRWDAEGVIFGLLLAFGCFIISGMANTLWPLIGTGIFGLMAVTEAISAVTRRRELQCEDCKNHWTAGLGSARS